jgi:probable phosphoglycerate mutase
VTKLLLVRHAMCDTVGKTIAGRMPGVCLNEEGREQALRTAARLKSRQISHVYSGPLQRAIETADAIRAATNARGSVLEDLNEIDFGDWTGAALADLDSRDDWRRFNTQRSVARIPNGETMLEVQVRVVRATETIARLHADETVVAVTHGDVIRAAVMHFAGISLDLFGRIEIDPASVTTIQLEPWGVKILGMNGLP